MASTFCLLTDGLPCFVVVMAGVDGRFALLWLVGESEGGCGFPVVVVAAAVVVVAKD